MRVDIDYSAVRTIPKSGGANYVGPWKSLPYKIPRFPHKVTDRLYLFNLYLKYRYLLWEAGELSDPRVYLLESIVKKTSRDGNLKTVPTTFRKLNKEMNELIIIDFHNFLSNHFHGLKITFKEFNTLWYRNQYTGQIIKGPLQILEDLGYVKSEISKKLPSGSEEAKYDEIRIFSFHHIKNEADSQLISDLIARVGRTTKNQKRTWIKSLNLLDYLIENNIISNNWNHNGVEWFIKGRNDLGWMFRPLEGGQKFKKITFYTRQGTTKEIIIEINSGYSIDKADKKLGGVEGETLFNRFKKYVKSKSNPITIKQGDPISEIAGDSEIIVNWLENFPIRLVEGGKNTKGENPLATDMGILMNTLQKKEKLTLIKGLEKSTWKASPEGAGRVFIQRDGKIVRAGVTIGRVEYKGHIHMTHHLIPEIWQLTAAKEKFRIFVTIQANGDELDIYLLVMTDTFHNTGEETDLLWKISHVFKTLYYNPKNTIRETFSKIRQYKFVDDGDGMTKAFSEKFMTVLETSWMKYVRDGLKINDLDLDTPITIADPRIAQLWYESIFGNLWTEWLNYYKWAPVGFYLTKTIKTNN